jgi:hypothetical protein
MTAPKDDAYHPCRTGLHVCGADAEGVSPITVLNLPTVNASHARALFERARAQFASAAGEPFDVMVDLMTAGDCDIEFPMTRQMLARLEAFAGPPDWPEPAPRLTARASADAARQARSEGWLP